MEMVLRFAIQLLGGLTLIGVTAAGITAFAYWLFKRFAGNWLDNRFKAQLANQKHDHDREIERLRFQIQTLLSRTTKIHDREFEALEELWRTASVATGSASGVLAIMQQAPDVSRIEGAELDWVLESCELPAWQVAEVKVLNGAPRGRKLYDFWLDKKRRQAGRDAGAFHDFVILRGIFLKEEVEAKARTLSNLIWELLDEDRWTAAEDGSAGFKSRRELNDRIRKEGNALRDEVRGMIRARLWDVDLQQG